MLPRTRALSESQCGGRLGLGRSLSAPSEPLPDLIHACGKHKKKRKREGSISEKEEDDDDSGTRHRRVLFLAVFLLGALLALLFALLLPDYLRAMREKAAQKRTLELFPAAEHLALIEDKDFYPNLPGTPLGDPEEPCPTSDPGATEEEEEAHVEDAPTKKAYYYSGTTELEEPRSREVSESPMECETEALKTLFAASKARDSKRALRLLKHAHALCPKHPRVLNQYGEFLERSGSDVVEADHLFVRAATFAEDGGAEHARALANRRRTALIIEEIDRGSLARIDGKKKRFQGVSESSAALKRAKREAYFQHIYHSAGIEGNTMTLAQTRSILETKLAVAGKSVMEHNELLGLDSALKYINQTLVDKVGEITMDDILQIHKRVIGYVDPIEAGMIRRSQVYVGDYVPPHPTHIELLMQRFVLWLNSPLNADTHPVRFAALAHYKLVYIHPFVDGNGRTSRLLMNLILMQSGYPPVIIRKQDRLKYYQTLVTANEGDIRPFVRFIAECTERTLDAYLTATQDHSLGARRRPAGDLVPFGMDDEDEHTIQDDEELKYHEKIVLGGLVGDNITVEP